MDERVRERERDAKFWKKRETGGRREGRSEKREDSGRFFKRGRETQKKCRESKRG